MMHITKVYKTSWGLFWDMETASKKQNRGMARGSRPEDGEREPVLEAWVLCAEGKIFHLPEVEVK
jgi:hypothetical protein